MIVGGIVFGIFIIIFFCIINWYSLVDISVIIIVINNFWFFINVVGIVFFISIFFFVFGIIYVIWNGVVSKNVISDNVLDVKVFIL